MSEPKVKLKQWMTSAKLREVFDRHISETKTIGRDGLNAAAVQASIQTIIEKISSDVKRGKYRYTPYKEVLKLKGASSNPRVISIPTVRDRILLKSLSNYLLEVFPDVAFEKAQHKVARVKRELLSGRWDSFVRLDITQFYPSIDHQVLSKALKSRISDIETVELIMNACQNPTIPHGRVVPQDPIVSGVPQGLAISNLLAEIVIHPLDSFFEQQTNVVYFRYVDDVIVLCQEKDMEEVDSQARKVLELLKLRAHPVKVGSKSSMGPLTQSVDYLGYKFDSGTVSVRENSVGKLENTLAKVFTKYRYALSGPPRGSFTQSMWPSQCIEVLEWRLNLVITGCYFEGAKRGWLHYFSELNDMELLKRLDRQVRLHCARFGIPESVQPKSFMRSYWAITRPNSRRAGYVPDFDSMGVSEKRVALKDIFLLRDRDIRNLNADEVSKVFSARMRKMISELEEDFRQQS